MALGRTQINSVTFDIMDIDNTKAAMEDCINTFQYVVNHLQNWADETTIGNELRSDLQGLVEQITRLDNETRKLTSTINEFLARQRRING